MSDATQHHWDKVYETKAENELSWFQAYPHRSVELIEQCNLPRNASVIDIGGGDSHLVDALLSLGFSNITVLDISAAGINRAKARLGEKAAQVTWIVSAITELKPVVQYDLWHDRAAFHFLTREEHIDKYVSIAGEAVKKDGYLILSTFSEKGPTKCSGLEIKQYSEISMPARFNEAFEKINCMYEDHTTPMDRTQNFIFCIFRRK
jgi:2-polyprenyl-3-methyl-5-hydroxy-6-metoxy-1,4-benzoquinol methylase